MINGGATNYWRKWILSCVYLVLLFGIVVLALSDAYYPASLLRFGASGAPATPTASQRFNTLPPGVTLPSESACAAHVRRNSWEPRPDNTTANQSVPTTEQIAQLSVWGPAIGLDTKANGLQEQITGSFTGTTDEILQWVACKWGIDEDIVRAEAIVESDWHQDQQGDQTEDQALCPPGTWNGNSCYQSYGILQVKYIFSPSSWPMSREDTAFNAEYAYGLIRTCYEGWMTYLSERTPLPGYARYHAGDIWGCIGRWYSGGWYDQGAVTYINEVKTALANEAWLRAGF